MSAEFAMSSPFLSEVSADAAHRIFSRVMLDTQDIPLTKLPLGGEDGLDPILAFMPFAKEGFALNLKSGNVLRDEIRGLLKYTTPDVLANHASELGITLRPKVEVEEPRLFLFRHSLATITCLSRSRMVITDEGTSFWPYKPSNEDIWNILSEVENATRMAIMERESAALMSTLRAAHFFAAGSHVAKGMTGV